MRTDFSARVCRETRGQEFGKDLSGKILRLQYLLTGTVLTLVLLPARVWAAEEGHAAGWGWLDSIGRWTNLLILFGILAYFLRAPLRRFFSGRASGIQSEIKSSADLYEKAQADRAAMEEKVRRIDEELAAIRLEAERDAEAERVRIAEQAEKDANRLKESSRREIENFTRAARKDLREFAAQLTVEMAENQIRKEMKPQDESRVIERFFVTLSEKKGNQGDL